MGEYIFSLIIGIGLLAGASFGLFNIYRQSKKNRDSYKFPKAQMIAYIFGIIFSGFMVLLVLLDLPNVLGKRTETYKGDCKVYISEGRFTTSTVDFENKSISFPEKNLVEEGKYYCDVEYYPNTQIGKTLKIYESKGGKLLNSN